MTRVALCDFDGTHFRETLEVSLADHLIASGLVEASAFAKSHERRRAWKRRDLTYPELTEAHWREVSEAFKGLRVDAVREVARQMIEQIGLHVSLFMREFVKSLHVCKYTVIGISGSNKETVEIFGEVHGYDRVIGTEYAREDGVYTGGVAYWPGENNKRDISKKLLEEYGASPESSIAIGDTANDFGMLQSVRYPIFQRNPRAREARARVVERVEPQHRHGDGTQEPSPYREVLPRSALSASCLRVYARGHAAQGCRRGAQAAARPHVRLRHQMALIQGPRNSGALFVSVREPRLVLYADFYRERACASQRL